MPSQHRKHQNSRGTDRAEKLIEYTLSQWPERQMPPVLLERLRFVMTRPQYSLSHLLLALSFACLTTFMFVYLRESLLALSWSLDIAVGLYVLCGILIMLVIALISYQIIYDHEKQGRSFGRSVNYLLDHYVARETSASDGEEAEQQAAAKIARN